MKINNPYENINWQKAKSYKANLHTHSTLSDGFEDTVTMFTAYQQQKYDFLAFAEHDAIQGPWPNHNINDGITHDNLSGLRGIGGLPAIDGWKTSDVLHIKGNEISKVGWENHHFGVYFSDFVNDGKCKSNKELIKKAADFDENSLLVIFHPGRYAYDKGAKRYWNSSDPDFKNVNSYYYNLPNNHTWNENDKIPKHIIDWYISLYKEKSNIVGLEVLNSGNQFERDREVWDDILTELMPNRPVWGYANDDSHGVVEEQVSRDMEFMVLEEKSVKHFKEAMKNGNFYFSSRYTLNNPKKYVPVKPPLKVPMPKVTSVEVDQKTREIIIEGENFNKVLFKNTKKTVLQTTTNYDYYVKSRFLVETEQESPISADRTKPLPKITNITVDQTTTEISIEGEFYNSISWISCGKQVASGSSVNCKQVGAKKYIRAVLTGEGGQSFTQPFGIVE